MVWYNLIYDVKDGELERAQSFDKEHLLVSKGRVNNTQRVRLLIILLITGIMLNSMRI